MPVVPVNFRIGAAFQPLDDLKSIIKFDGVVNQAILTGRSQDGGWYAWTGAGVALAGAFATPSVGIKSVYVSISDFDANDVVGHPDASRLGQMTLLTGQHRARTQYWIRAGSANITTPNGGAPLAAASVAPAVGMRLGVTLADAPTAAAINAAVGANSCTLNVEGCLFSNQVIGVRTDEAVAICLSAPDANGFIEYVTL